jgi:putative transposase
MSSLSYRRHRFPIDVIQQAVWLYFQFPLSLRNVEDLLAQRGIDASYETVRRWSVKFGLAYAKTLRKTHPRADVRWHLDEVFVRINGKCVYLWRAVDCEGEVLDVPMQSRRNKQVALKLMRKLLKSQGFCPTVVVTDKLPSYGAIYNTFNVQRHLISRRTLRQFRAEAMSRWNIVTAVA